MYQLCEKSSGFGICVQ